MSNSVVSTIEAMTPEWFTEQLSASGVLSGGKVTEVTTSPVGGGIIANMIRAELSYDGANNAPASVVVKYPSDDEGSFGVAQAMGLYELEVKFYQDIAPLVPNMSTPACYGAALDSETGRFNLILEDRGGSTRPGDVLSEASPEECSAVFEQLVNFQAPLWNSPKLKELAWLQDQTRNHAVFDGIPAGLAPFLDRFGEGLDEKHVQLFEQVMPHSGKWVRSWSEPSVVQHGDFRSDNILFGTTPDVPAVTVIDFQTARLGPPGVDAAYFTASSLSTDTRRKLERGLVEEYHQRLLAGGVKNYDWDACWKDYCEGAMYGVYLFVGMASQVESTERGDLLIVDQIKRYADMAIDLDSPKIAGVL